MADAGGNLLMSFYHSNTCSDLLIVLISKKDIKMKKNTFYLPTLSWFII